MDPLDEILAACGIPDESKYRMVARRDGHNVVSDRGTLMIGGVTLPIKSFQMHHSVDAFLDEEESVGRVSDWIRKRWVDHGDE